MHEDEIGRSEAKVLRVTDKYQGSYSELVRYSLLGYTAFTIYTYMLEQIALAQLSPRLLDFAPVSKAMVTDPRSQYEAKESSSAGQSFLVALDLLQAYNPHVCFL